MAQSLSSSDPYASIGQEDPYASVGVSSDPYTVTPEQRQLATSNLARLRQLREEQDARMAAPKYRVGIQLPFMDEPIASLPIPAELAAFGSEAAKGILPTGAGVAAASAVTPYSNAAANLLQVTPGGRLTSPLVRFGAPLVAGGIGAMGTRLAEDVALPAVLPEASARSYELGTQLAAENPTSAMLGQFASGGPFFRPGLPINTTGGARFATPLITGGIGAGIEGAQQLTEGQFDPQRLAIAAAGSALMNRETALGARLGPNLVLPDIPEYPMAARSASATTPGDATLTLPEVLPIDVAPEAQTTLPGGSPISIKTGDRYFTQEEIDKLLAIEVPKPVVPDAVLAQNLTERLAGKTPEQQLAVVKQETALNKDILTPSQERSALDIQQGLEAQIAEKNAIEDGIAAQQKAQADAQKAIQEQQKAIAEAQKPPELPKSAQILAEPTSKPPSIANVATEVATQTKNSPYALQEQLNKMTSPVATDVAGGVPPAAAVADNLQARIDTLGGIYQEPPLKPGQLRPINAQSPRVDMGAGAYPMTPENLKAAIAANKKNIARGAIENGDKLTPAQLEHQKAELRFKEAALKKFEDAMAERNPPPSTTPPTKKQMIATAVAAPDTQWQYTVQRGRDGKGGFTQVDAISNGENTVSSNPADLRKAGADIPDVPDWVPQGQYSREQIQDFIKQGEPANVPTPKPAAADQGAAGKAPKAERKVDRHTVDLPSGKTLSIVVSKNTIPGEPPFRATEFIDGKAGTHRAYSTIEEARLDAAKTAEFAKDGIDESMGAFMSSHAMDRPKAVPAPKEEVGPLPPSAEQRLNDAGLDLPPISSMSRDAKRAELEAGGVKDYNGQPLADLNGAQISNALGKFRRRELGAIRPGVAATAGGGAVGGVTGFVSTDREPGETDDEFNARRLRNAALGAAAGAGVGGGAVSLMSRGAQASRAARAAASSTKRAEVPTTGEDQGVRRTAEKIIENKSYPDRLTKVLSEDPDILYDRFKLNELKAIVKGSTDAQLQTMLASPNKSESLAATAELANRYSLSNDPALQEQGAALYSQFAQSMTNPAQMLGLGKLIESPDGYVAALNETLKKVGRKLSAEQEGKMKDLARTAIRADQELDAATVMAERDFSPENEKAYTAAEKSAATARKAVDDFTHRVAPESWSDILSKIVQGNLLTPLSILVNPTSNLIFQPVLRASSTLGSMVDEVISTVFRKPRVLNEVNPFPGKGELKAFADGVRVGAKELLTGPGVDSYAKTEVQRGFKPLRALTQAFTGKDLAVRDDGTVALSDRGKKLLEGTFGAPAEVAFRFLNLGDKPFRRSEEARVLFEQAKLKGLKGRDLEKFLLFPDKNTQKLIETEGRAAIFAQDNPGVRKVSALLDHGIADLLDLPKDSTLRGFLKVAARTQVPYRQVPVNILSTALNFAVPEVAFARALIKGKNDRRGALLALGQGMLGTMMYQGANWLWDNGLISEPADKDAKIRSAQYEQFGPAKINVSGLQRAIAGGDPKWQSGDTAMDWGRFGPPAFVFHIFTSNAAKGRKESARTGENRERTYGPGRFAQDRISSFPGMANFALDQSFLSGTSAFLEAMRDWDQFGDRWTQNTFRAVSSIPVPNTVEAFARTQYKYIPELRGDNLRETLKNVWDYKTLQLPKDERTTLKRDIWGDPIQRTQGEKNPYVDQFVDVFRTVTKTNEPFKKALVDLFQETYSPDVYPSIPTRDFALNGVTVKLNPKDYEDYQRFIGTARREFANEVVSDGSFTAPDTIAEEKILMLQNAYSQGQKAGSAMLQENPGFFERYPELLDQPAASPEESRVMSRDVKARARQRLGQEEAVPVEDPYEAVGR